MSSVSDGRGGAVQKLPLWNTICLSYSTFFRNFLDVLLICWLWLIVVTPLMGIANAMQLSWAVRTIAELKQRAALQRTPVLAPMPVDLRVLIFGGALLLMAAGVSIAVAWHRRVILGERPRLSGSNIATGSFWRYIGVGIAIFLIAFIPMVFGGVVSLVVLWRFVPHGTPGGPHGGIAVAIVLIMLLLYLTGIAVMLRLILLLPARAVGDLSVTLRQTWHRTRGNIWRLFWGIMACTVPPMLIIEIPFWIFIGFPHPQSFANGTLPVPVLAISAIWAVFVLLALLILPIWIGFLSLSYLHFFERRPGYSPR
jgi:hypothetical protein